MLRPQKLAKGPLKAFKGKGEKCGIGVGERLAICMGDSIKSSAAPFTVYRYLHSERPVDEAKMPILNAYTFSCYIVLDMTIY